MSQVLPTREDIQKLIDGAIKERHWDRYVDFATYLPADATAPAGTTHLIRIGEVNAGGKVEVAVKVKPLYNALLGAILSAY